MRQEVDDEWPEVQKIAGFPAHQIKGSKIRNRALSQEPLEEGPIAESMETRMCTSSGGKSGHCRGRAASPNGVRHDIRGIRKRAELLQGNPFRCAAGGRLALARPGTCRTLEGHA